MMYLHVSQAPPSSHTHTHTHAQILISNPSTLWQMILISTKIQLCKSWPLLMPKLKVILDPTHFLTSYSQLLAQTTLMHVVLSCLDHCSSSLTPLSATLPPRPDTVPFK